MCKGNSVGTVVKLLKTDADEIKLACYAIKRTGEVGCRVAFASKKYALEDLWQLYDGATVCIVQIFLPTSESRASGKDNSTITSDRTYLRYVFRFFRSHFCHIY
jgi:hypothetical protein